MEEQFDPEKFERLSGLELGLYAGRLMKAGNLPPDCLDFFRQNAARWDGLHLEAGLVFLAKIDSQEAVHEIANYVGHPTKYIGYTVLVILSHKQLDDYVIRKINEAIPTIGDPSYRRHMEDLLRKKSDEK